MKRTRRHHYGVRRSYRPTPAESQFAVKFVEAGLRAWLVPALTNSVCNAPFANAEACSLALRDADKTTEDFRNYVITAGILGVATFLQAL
jgi:hypothetical protein